MTWKNAIAYLVLVVVILVFTTACGALRRGRNLTLGTEIALTGEAFLTCSQECADRSQCGQSEQGKMVLLHSQNPATREHDLAVAERTPVMVELQQSLTAYHVWDETPLVLPYYLVSIPERGMGWIPGFCVGQ